MTDRERLLEQVREAEERAAEQGRCAVAWMGHTRRAPQWQRGVELTGESATRAAHHALTALALLEVIDQVDEFCIWADAPAVDEPL